MNKILSIVLSVLLLSQLIVLTISAETDGYHNSLITHWDFEGNGSDALKDKAVGGASSDKLSTHGSGIKISDGVAYIPSTAGAYLSAKGGSGTDLYDFKNTTIIMKVAVLNHPTEIRNSVAAFFSKDNAFTFTLQNAVKGDNQLLFVTRANNAWNNAESIVIPTYVFCTYAVTFSYDESTKELKSVIYFSDAEKPQRDDDFQVIVEQSILDTTGGTLVESAKDLILGRRYNHLNDDKLLISYFDDVKIYSEVLTLDEVVADCAPVSDYEIDMSKVLPNTGTYYDKLEGVSMYALGDSYFHGSGIGRDKSWPTLLSAKYGMSCKNDGVNGSTLANFKGYDPAKYRVPMVLRYTETMPAENVDIILLEGGRNDRGKKVPMGTNDSTDPYTFKGAINVMINTFQEKYPNALIVCVTPWNALDITSPSTLDYAVAMTEVCAYRNIACINAADPDVVGVDINDADFRAEYCTEPDDFSHLNVKGMQYVLPYFEEAIAKLYYEHIGEDFVDQTPGKYSKEDAVKNDPTVSDGEETSNAEDSATTETPATTEKSPFTDENKNEKKGCFSVMGISSLSLVMLAGACGFTFKKRRKE